MKKTPSRPSPGRLLWIPPGVCAVLLLAVSLVLPRPAASPSAPSVTMPLPAIPYDAYPLAAHALGPVDGQDYAPCLEGFLENYALGYRVFECDFLLTADGEVVLRHDWASPLQAGIDEDHVPTLEAFLATPILGTYTPLSFRDLLELMEDYPDIWIITDSKYTDEASVTAQFSAMAETAASMGRDFLLDRLIVQVYSPEMQDTVEAVRHFDHYLLTLYQTEFYGEDEILEKYAREASRRGMDGLVMFHFLYKEAWLPLLEELDLRLYVHTVADAQQAQGLLDRGVWGVYADGVPPSAVRRPAGGEASSV